MVSHGHAPAPLRIIHRVGPAEVRGHRRVPRLAPVKRWIAAVGDGVCREQTERFADDTCIHNVFGPMLLEGSELAGLKAPHVGCHPLSLVKELHRALGEPHVQFDVNERVWSAVIVLIDGHVVIDVDLGFLPNGQLVRLGRQRQQDGLFVMFKPTVPRAVQLLKGLGVELD